MQIFGHRGASGRLPENTLSALAGAIEDGADGVEVDLQATADGQIVLLHDDTLERTGQGRGRLRDLTRDALTAETPDGVEPPPTLMSVLETIGDRLTLDLELKQAGIESLTLATLAKFPDARWFISSFDYHALRVVRGLSTRAPLWPLAVDFDCTLIETAREMDASGLALHWSAVNAATAGQARESGLGIAVWTVNDLATARTMQSLGVDVLITDQPGTIRTGLDPTDGQQ